MGFLRQIFNNAATSIEKEKLRKEQEREFVRNNEGSKAISEYMTDLFQKENSAYCWIKENNEGLFPKVFEDYVALCYLQLGDGQSISGMKPKDIVIHEYTFEEIYAWYGLEENVGFHKLTSKLQMKELEGIINSQIGKLAHLKFNGAYLVKMFQ